MNIKYLYYFDVLADEMHFTNAAKRLHIAQPALSIAIKNLETHFGLTLFHRQGKQIYLTYEGNALRQQTRILLQQMTNTERVMADLKGVESGEVRLGVPGMLGSYYFPEILFGFKQRYPNLKLTLVEAGAASLKTMLIDGDIDMAVIIDEDVPETLATDPLLKAEMVAVAAENHPISQQESITFPDFFDQPLVLFKSGYFHRDYIDAAIDKHQVKPNIAYETNLLPLILQIVRKEQAMTALLRLVTEHEAGITPISFDQPIVFDLALAWRKESYLSVADRTFIEFIKQSHQTS
ncbi:LysR family transcriptional regulator [Thaumasiovibrio subtropicus]|uniref:LysR family transcriptional regulator n=1 Tax=Thaumasiovibrio subtropicus TaxID=1891207 RepID=UPI001864093B|nr:LysR family transcriptional regulator [Thaumasiovibrio subtropicus]